MLNGPPLQKVNLANAAVLGGQIRTIPAETKASIFRSVSSYCIHVADSAMALVCCHIELRAC